MTRTILIKSLGIAWLISAAILATSCGSTFMVAADDVYGTVPTREQEWQYRQQAQAEAYPEAGGMDELSYASAQATDTFNYDNYYDYEYTSRLRRFHDDDYLSDDYYSDYYTNYYWYDSDPYYYGTSIYLGYNWWYPPYTCYRPGWYLGFSYGPFYWGWGSYYWPYRYWSDYAWGYVNGYWNGYWDGYYDRYWNEYCYDYCYNPYDRNTYAQSQYGKRISGGSSLSRPVTIASSAGSIQRAQGSGRVASELNTGSGSSGRNVRVSFAERYETAMQASGSDPALRGPSSGSASGSASGSTPRISQSSAIGTATSVSSTSKASNAALAGSAAGSNNRTPSAMIDHVSRRLASKPAVSVSSSSKTTNPSIKPSTGSSVPRVQPAAAPRTATSQTSAVRAPQNGTQTRTTAAPQGTQQRTQQRTSQSYRPSAPASSAQPRQTGSQPLRYSNPAYNRSRSNSSYVSPQYNNSTRMRTYSVPARTAPARTAPARTTPSRPANVSTSRPASSSSVSRPAAPSRSSSTSAPVRRTR